MRTRFALILIALCGLPGFAFASPMNCDAHEIIAGSPGTTGHAIVDVAPGAFSWSAGSDDATALLDAKTFCGQSTDACHVMDMSTIDTPKFVVTCDGSANGYLLYSAVTKDGRFECRSTASGFERRIIEFSNCH